MKRKIISLILGLALILSMSSGIFAATHEVEWGGTFSFEGNNTMTTKPLPTDPNKVEEAWAAPVGNNTIVIADDYIYTYNGVLSDKGTFYKIDKNTGEVKNSLSLPYGSGYYYSFAVYGGGNVYVSIPGKVMAFDIDEFKLLWAVDGSTSDFATIQYINGALVTNGIVINAENGTKIKTLAGSYSMSSGAEADGFFYVPGTDSKVHAFNTTTWDEVDTIAFNGIGASLMCNVNTLYWASKSGYIYSVKVENGIFNDDSLTTYNTNGYSFAVPPVCSDGRVYFAGHLVTSTDFNTGYAAIFVFNSAMQYQYTAKTLDDGHKIQSAPILQSASSGGSVIAGLYDITSQADTTNYVYIQSYKSPGSLYILADHASASSGNLVELARPEHPNYAFEQLAFDKDGAIYYTNDSNYLYKIQTEKTKAPRIIKNLSTETVEYKQGDLAEALVVEAELDGKGTLSYQWQSRSGNKGWSNIEDATSSAYVPSTFSAGTVKYRCVVKNTWNNESLTANSAVATITVIENSEVIPELIMGDLNSDDKVDLKDVTVLRRVVAQWSDVIANLDVADVDGSETVDLKDVTILRRYVADWEGIVLGK